MNSKKPHQDGGWGWMVVIGTLIINMVNQSLFANYGLIFGEYIKSISGGHATGITLVMALSVVVTNFAGLIVGPLLKILDIRTFTFIGVGCVGTGMIISSFGTAIWHIVIGYSIFTDRAVASNAVLDYGYSGCVSDELAFGRKCRNCCSDQQWLFCIHILKN